MRVFVGIDPPVDLRKELAKLGRDLFSQWNIKLVEEENLHLTLLFIGNISLEKKEKLIKVLRQLRGLQKISLTTRDIEFFPNESDRRGIWLTVSGEKEKLFSLYKKIVDSCLNLGIDIDKNDLRFFPHITLGRFREKPEHKKLTSFFQGFVVDKFTLFESRLSSRGSVYLKIAEIGLK